MSSPSCRAVASVQKCLTWVNDSSSFDSALPDLNISSPASTASEESLCATALPYTDIVSVVERSSSESSSDTEEHVKQLKEFKRHVEKERTYGEYVPIVFSHRAELTPLTTWLDNWGPFPVHTYLAARIVKDMAAAFLALHSVKYSFGPNLLENIYLDSNYHAHLLVEHALRPGKVPDRFPMEDDMFRLGEVLYLLVTGKQAHFNEEQLKLEPPPHTLCQIDPDGLKLAHWLLSCHPKNRPTAGGVVHHQWPQTKDSRAVSFLL